MRCNGISHPGVFNVFHAKLLAGLFNNLADLRIVDMRNFWKQVVLNLKIKPAYQPRHQFVLGGKICSGFNLVHRHSSSILPLVSSGIGKAVCSTVCAS